MADTPFVAVDIEPIGRLRPVGEHAARIDLDPERYPGDTLRGLETFTHAVVVVHGDPPRWNDWPVGRASGQDYPDSIAVTTAELTGSTASRLHLEGLRVATPYPVVDVKPYMKEFGPFGPESQPFWLSEVDRSEAGRSDHLE
ncbi:MAG: hypothetical protein ACOCYZ_04730 [Halococcoides sp.]